DVTGSWFTISCNGSGAHTATYSGGPTTFTLDPDVDFSASEVCTVTVIAAQVTDQDASDPPNTMSANAPFSFTTAGVVNVCEQPFTHTYEIQGSGNSFAIAGIVTTQGVVVGDFEGPTSVGLQGFFIQDADGDGDNATSDGLFVFTNNADNGLNAGDVVRVTGPTSEFNSQTQVSGTAAGAIVSCGTDDLPAAVDVSLPQATPTELERYEGMRTRFTQTLVISEYFEFEQFGEIVLALPHAGEDRLFTPTSLEEPGSSEAAARLSLNQLSQVRLNDGLANSNPTTVRHPNGLPFSLSNRFRGGDHVANAVGILGERTVAANPFPRYRIEPTGPADYTAVNPRQASPDDVGGNLQVAAMNTLNYFLTADFPTGNPNDNKCGPLQNVECRGHDSIELMELSRQRAKLLAALSGLGAEVIGLNELENTPNVDPVGDIVAGLNALEGAGTYSYIDTGVIGTDAIRVGLVYKPGVVTPVGAFQILDSTDDPRFIDTLNRPVLAQTFRVNATGAVFTIAVNHLKSKNSSPACLPDSGDGQGSCSEVREAAAQALVDWLASDPTGSNDPDFLIVGDLNSYAKEDPIDAVRAGADDVLGTGDDYTNLIDRYVGDHAYSYVFDAMSGYLDHALATASLDAQVTGATEWHINADEPDIFDYDTSFKPPSQEALYEPNAFRSSDHDPVIVGLNLAPAAGKVTGSGTWADGSFNVSAQFLKDATSPTGSTTLVVPEGTFMSTGYDWMIVSGDRATLQGTGTLNGNPGYGFRLTVKDGGSPATNDRIRVEIWDEDGEVVYDSQPGDPVGAAPTASLTSGNLTIHKTK
ncbi:MAG TPA: ExeM/NucH family extracellular endonuclease, partial [Candidatus Limnocylindrales bacterium]|nr:ExeM/NucH family extracellular endonuclease [Candidatus Limnocylindrales bacterium]